MSAGNMVTGRKTVQSVGMVATVTAQEVAATGPPHAVPRIMGGAATGWPRLHQLIIWVALSIVGLVTEVGCHLPLVGSVAMPLTWGIGTPAERLPPTQRGHQLMIITVSIAVLIIMKSTELALLAQAISRIVACPISPLPHPPLPPSQSSPPV